MAAKLSEGDTVGLTGEVTMVHDDGTVTLPSNATVGLPPCTTPRIGSSTSPK